MLKGLELQEAEQSQKPHLKEISLKRLKLVGLLTENNSPKISGEPKEKFITPEKCEKIYGLFKGVTEANP